VLRASHAAEVGEVVEAARDRPIMPVRRPLFCCRKRLIVHKVSSNEQGNLSNGAVFVSVVGRTQGCRRGRRPRRSTYDIAGRRQP